MAVTSGMYSQAIVLMAGAVFAAPLFKRLGMETVLGYLFAGVILGPIFGIVSNGKDILNFAELGIVFLLFIVGLELKPSRLWSMRKDILGLGSAQVIGCGLLLTLLMLPLLKTTSMAIVAGFGMALSSTAFTLQMLENRGEINAPHGRKTFSILLFQDMAIIPLLALLPLLTAGQEIGPGWQAFLLAISAIAVVILAGRYILDPLLNFIAATGAKEVMIATALLVVFGSAMLMHSVGLSMALGSFLAGVLLAESSYRVELEANIEPFRGILLGLFFMAVGLSLDVTVLFDNWWKILLIVPIAMTVKAVAIFYVSRFFGSSQADSIRSAAMLSQHGEFGFVLFAAAAQAYILDTETASFLIAIVVLSMALTPVSIILGSKLLERQEVEEEMVEDFEGAKSPILMIGFSRMGQISAQILLASGTDVTVIDSNPEMIRRAERFGFRIYYGDGMRKDVLISAGIEQCSLVAVCTHSPSITNKIVDIITSEFPDKPIFVRAYDRAHTLDLMERNVSFHIRETFESAMVFGIKMLETLGHSEPEAEAVADEIRRLDRERLFVQHREGIQAGTDHLHQRPVQPEPLVEPIHATANPDDEKIESKSTESGEGSVTRNGPENDKG